MMSRVCRASLGMLLLLLAHVGLVYYIATHCPTSIAPNVQSVPSRYQRLSKNEIQQSLVIVSDMTSHFGREVALNLADMGFFVLAGVRTEADRKAYTGYNTIKGLESFVLDISDPMDMVEMSYRVTQIQHKYKRSLLGLVVVDTHGTDDVRVPHSEWVKQRKISAKLARSVANSPMTNENNESVTTDNTSVSAQELEELFHLNTRKRFDIHATHSLYQHAFQGPYRLVQACYDLAQSSVTNQFRVAFLRPAVTPYRQGSLFAEDLIIHTESLLAAREEDETSLQRKTSLSLAQSVVEYAHTPPSVLPPSPLARRSKKSKSSSSLKRKGRPPSSLPLPVSTTSTPSAVSSTEVSAAVVHSLTSFQPQRWYRVGGLKMQVIKMLFGGSSGSGDKGTMTCDGSLSEDNAMSILEWLGEELISSLRVAVEKTLSWLEVSTVTIPLSLVEYGTRLLPPVVTEWLWQAVLIPSLVAVV